MRLQKLGGPRCARPTLRSIIVPTRITCLMLLFLSPLPLYAGDPATKPPPITDRLKADVKAAPLSMRFQGETEDKCRA